MSVIQTHNKGAGGIPNVYVDNDGNLQFKAVLSDTQEFSLAPGGEVKVSGLNFDNETTSVTLQPSGKFNTSTRPSGTISFNAVSGSLVLGTNAGGSSTQSFSAGKFAINVFSINDVGNLYGLSGTAVKQGDGDVNKMYGLYFLGRAYGGGKTGILKGAHIETNLFNGAQADELYGVHSYVNLTGATAKKIAGVYSQIAMLNASGIEEYYGLLIEQTDVAASVRTRAIYSLSNEPSTFNGFMGVGQDTKGKDPEADLHIRSKANGVAFQIGDASTGIQIKTPDFFGAKLYYGNLYGAFFPGTAWTLDCGTMMSGGKLMVWQNAGTDKAWVDADGYLHCKGVINI
jgi:hypothetical protein